MKWAKLVKSSKTNIPLKHLEALKDDMLKVVSKAKLLDGAEYNFEEKDLEYIQNLMDEAANSISFLNVKLKTILDDLVRKGQQ